MWSPEPASRGHVVACALPFWGHTKALCVLLSKLVRLRPIYATLFTEASILDKVRDEFTRQFSLERGRAVSERIRVVVLPSPHNPFQLDAYQVAFLEGYNLLFDGKAIHAGGDSHVTYEAIAPPRLVILDFFFFTAMLGIRSISGSTIPIYAWQSGAVAALLYLFGPESMGGNGDVTEKLRRIEAIDTESRNREIEKIYHRTNGRLVEIKGMPPMYDYEHVPQISALPVEPIEVILMSQYAHNFLSECDGIVNISSRLYEEGPFELLHEWFKTRPVLAVGPLSDSDDTAKCGKCESIADKEVSLFLNSALDRFGPYSVVYISFGSIWWTAEPEKLWIILDVLVEEEIPFLLSHTSPIAVIPDEVSAKVKASGLGYMASWLPQHMVLHHKACGWFVTHCGHNSVMESLNAGVPLICWPFSVDQPVNAVNVSMTHNAGYELLEIRNGHGLRPLRRLENKSPEGTDDAVRREAIDVFRRARGIDGNIKRAKAQWFSERLKEDGKHGGRAWAELNDLAAIIVSSD